jgi:hypothetical protein
MFACYLPTPYWLLLIPVFLGAQFSLAHFCPESGEARRRFLIRILVACIFAVGLALALELEQHLRLAARPYPGFIREDEDG